MTNDAIVSHPWYKAVVFADFNVGNVGITEESRIHKIFPNPTDGKVYIKTETDMIPKVKLTEKLVKN